MTVTQRLNELSGKLPLEAQSELLDFAEFLSRKNLGRSGSGTALHALQGGLEHSAAFADSPMAIQERLRREWD